MGKAAPVASSASIWWASSTGRWWKPLNLSTRVGLTWRSEDPSCSNFNSGNSEGNLKGSQRLRRFGILSRDHSRWHLLSWKKWYYATRLWMHRWYSLLSRHLPMECQIPTASKRLPNRIKLDGQSKKPWRNLLLRTNRTVRRYPSIARLSMVKVSWRKLQKRMIYSIASSVWIRRLFNRPFHKKTIRPIKIQTILKILSRWNSLWKMINVRKSR